MPKAPHCPPPQKKIATALLLQGGLISNMGKEFPSPIGLTHMAKTAPDVTPLQQIMARLRHPEYGCDWDRSQDFASIAPYTIEEAYEVYDAIQRNDMAALKDELGDLLLQVVFHSKIAEDLDVFSLSDVISTICNKMIRRHPHIFGDAKTSPGWDQIKAQERAVMSDDPSALAGVARALPALSRAEKLQKRAARVGFDWDDISDVKAKILEEIEEIEGASSQEALTEEVGDLLFAVANLARHLHVEPEGALRAANDKFERRFRAMETLADGHFDQLDLAGQEALWQDVKRNERTSD